MAATKADFFLGEDRKWNYFDFMLLILVLVEFLLRASASGESMEVWTQIGDTIRTARVLRIFRCLRFSRSFRQIFLKVSNAMKPMFWVLIGIAMLLYTVAVCIAQGVVMMREDREQEEVGEERYIKPVSPDLLQVEEDFGSVVRAMYTLFKSVAMGQPWGPSVKALSHVEPVLSVLTVLFIAVTVICVLNIVTGIFVEASNGLVDGQSQRELMAELQERKEKKYAKVLRNALSEVTGDDEATTIPKEVLQEFLRHHHVAHYLHCSNITDTEVHHLFHLLQCENATEVNVDDFVQGCVSLHQDLKRYHLHKIVLKQVHIEQKLDQLTAGLCGGPPKRDSSTSDKSSSLPLPATPPATPKEKNQKR